MTWPPPPLTDIPPTGAVGDPERAYWKVGSGLPGDGGMVGYDLAWLDADGNVIGRRLTNAAPKDPITEAEYDALIAQWQT